MVNAEVVQKGLSMQKYKRDNYSNKYSTNKNKYEGPLKLIDESSKENISVEISQRIEKENKLNLDR